MHEKHLIKEPDSKFDRGCFKHLVVGNKGRVLDGRRTPGYIEKIDENSAVFIWKITAFEDQGKTWEIPMENISSCQFMKDSATLSEDMILKYKQKCHDFSEKLVIKVSKEIKAKSQSKIKKKESLASDWIKENSLFYKKHACFDLDKKEGYEDLYFDLKEYLRLAGVLELEEKTANQYVLNPHSGEWIKGLKIVMAEMGLINYDGTIPRTADVFCGIGEKNLRRIYVTERMSFLRAIFKLYGYKELVLYRGMSSEIDFFKTPSTLLSATFSSDVAKEYASIDSDSFFRNCYFVKFTYPVENLFMTYLETEELNQRYKEKEAIICYTNDIQF